MLPDQGERRSTGQMPVRRRHEGLTATDRRDEEKQWRLLAAFLASSLLGGLAHFGNIMNLPLLNSLPASVPG